MHSFTRPNMAQTHSSPHLSLRQMIEIRKLRCFREEQVQKSLLHILREEVEKVAVMRKVNSIWAEQANQARASRDIRIRQA